MFKAERSLKIAAKRCQHLRWEVYELILEGIVSIGDICNAGMMVPSSCQVCCSLCDEMHRLMGIRSNISWVIERSVVRIDLKNFRHSGEDGKK
jgi:hypothetical protein